MPSITHLSIYRFDSSDSRTRAQRRSFFQSCRPFPPLPLLFQVHRRRPFIPPLLLLFSRAPASAPWMPQSHKMMAIFRMRSCLGSTCSPTPHVLHRRPDSGSLVLHQPWQRQPPTAHPWLRPPSARPQVGRPTTRPRLRSPMVRPRRRCPMVRPRCRRPTARPQGPAVSCNPLADRAMEARAYGISLSSWLSLSL